MLEYEKESRKHSEDKTPSGTQHSSSSSASPLPFNPASASSLLAPSTSPRQRIPEANMFRNPTDSRTIINRQPSPLPGLPMQRLTTASKTPASSQKQNDGRAILRVLEELAGQVLWDTAQVLLGEVMTTEYFKSYQAMRDLYKEIQTIAASGDSLMARFSRVEEALRAHALHSGKARDYLEAIAGWAHAVASQWESAEQLYETGKAEWKSAGQLYDNVKNEEAWLGKLGYIAQETERVLTLTVVYRQLGPENTARLQKVVTPVKTLLLQVHALRSRPGGMHWQDYLTLMLEQQSYLPEELARLLKLGQRLAALQGVSPFPDKASVAEQLAWLVETLSDPQLGEQAGPLLGDTVAEHLKQILVLGQTIKAFPADAGLYQQACWLSELLSQVPGLGSTNAAAFLQSMAQVMGVDTESRELFEQLIKLAAPDASRRELIQQIGQHVVVPALYNHGPELAYQAIKPWLPPPVSSLTDFLREFFSRVSPHDSWSAVSEHFLDSAAEEMPNYLLNMASSTPLASQTLQLAKTIGRHQTFGESLIYIVSQTRDQNQEAKSLYWLYTSGRLSWQIQEAMRLGSMADRKSALNEIARAIRETQILSVYPQLEKITDLLPMLPDLYEVGKYMQETAGESTWLGWGERAFGALDENSDLKAALSTLLSSWLAKAILSGLSGMGQSKPADEPPSQKQAESAGDTPRTPVTGSWLLPGAEAGVLSATRGSHVPGVGDIRLDTGMAEPRQGLAEEKPSEAGRAVGEGGAAGEFEDNDVIEEDEFSWSWRGMARGAAWGGLALGALVTLGMLAKSLYANRSEARTDDTEMQQFDDGVSAERGTMLPVEPGHGDQAEEQTSADRLVPTGAAQVKNKVTLPLTTAALGLGIPAMVLLGLRLTEDAPYVPALTQDETDRIVDEMKASKVTGRVRGKRAAEASPAPSTGRHHSQHEFVSKILIYVPPQRQEVLTTRLATIVAEICQSYKTRNEGAAPKYIHLLTLLDYWLIMAKTQHLPEKDPAADEVLMLAELQEAVRTQLDLQRKPGNSIEGYLSNAPADASYPEAWVLSQSQKMEHQGREYTVRDRVHVLKTDGSKDDVSIGEMLRNEHNDIAFIYYYPLFKNPAAMVLLEKYRLRNTGKTVSSLQREKAHFIKMVDIHYAFGEDEELIEKYAQFNELPENALESRETIRQTNEKIRQQWQVPGTSGNVADTLAFYDNLAASYKSELDLTDEPAKARLLRNSITLLEVEKRRQAQLSQEMTKLINGLKADPVAISDDMRVAINQVMILAWKMGQPAASALADKEILSKTRHIRTMQQDDPDAASDLEKRFVMLFYIIMNLRAWMRDISQITVDEFYQLSALAGGENFQPGVIRSSEPLSLRKMFAFYEKKSASPAQDYTSVSQLKKVHEFEFDSSLHDQINTYKRHDARNEASDAVHYMLNSYDIYPLDLDKPLKRVVLLELKYPAWGYMFTHTLKKSPGFLTLIQTDSDDYWIISSLQNIVTMNRISGSEFHHFTAYFNLEDENLKAIKEQGLFNESERFNNYGTEKEEVSRLLIRAGNVQDILPSAPVKPDWQKLMPLAVHDYKIEPVSEDNANVKQLNISQTNLVDLIHNLTELSFKGLAEDIRNFRFTDRLKLPSDWEKKTAFEKAKWIKFTGWKITADFYSALFKPLEMLRNWLDNDEYQPSEEDWVELAVDVIVTAISLGIVAVKGISSVTKAFQAGMKQAAKLKLTGKELKLFMFRAVRPELIKQSAAMGRAMIGEVFPVVDWASMLGKAGRYIRKHGIKAKLVDQGPVPHDHDVDAFKAGQENIESIAPNAPLDKKIIEAFDEMEDAFKAKRNIAAKDIQEIAGKNERFLAKLLGYADVDALKAADIDDVINQWIKRVDLGLAQNLTIQAKKISDFKANFSHFERKISGLNFDDASLSFTKKFNSAFEKRKTTFLKQYQGDEVKSYSRADGSDSKITMMGSPVFINKTTEALAQIESLPDGRIVLDEISKRGSKLSVTPPTLANVAYEKNGIFYGKNSSAGSITFDPQNRNLGHPDLVQSEPWRNRPPSVGLYHELLHVYYNAHQKTYVPNKVPQGGSNSPLKVSGSSSAADEAMITGANYTDPAGRQFPFADVSYRPLEDGIIFSENRFRQQLAYKHGMQNYRYRPYYGKSTGQPVEETLLPIPEQQKMLVDFNQQPPPSLAYRNTENKIGDGKYGVVYRLDDANVMKDYRPKKIPLSKNLDYRGAYDAAVNNSKAFNYVYGNNSSNVYRYLEGGTPKISTRMRKLEGESLFQLTMKTDSKGLSQLKYVYDSLNSEKITQMTDDVVGKLTSNGIYHKDLVQGNLIYNDKTGRLQPVDFDEAEIIPDGGVLSKSQVDLMRENMRATLLEFKESAGNTLNKNIGTLLASTGYIKTSITHPGGYDVYALRSTSGKDYSIYFWDVQTKKLMPFGTAMEKNGKWIKMQLEGGGFFDKGAKLEDIKTLDSAIYAIKHGNKNDPAAIKNMEDLLISGDNKAEVSSIQDYVEAGSAEINRLLRSKKTSPTLKTFLRDFNNLNDYRGMSYRAAYVGPGGKKALEKGIGKMFSDEGVQSASTIPVNANSWAEDGFVKQSKTKDSTPVVFVFDKSVNQKNMSSALLADHVAVVPGSPLELLAVKKDDGILYAYFTFPTEYPTSTYRLFDGVKEKFAKR